MTEKVIENDQTYWGQRNITVTIVCAAVFFILGFFTNKWLSNDIREETIKYTELEIINNAICELNYNLQIAWYQDRKFIDDIQYFSLLRTQALWAVFYDSDRLFPNNKAIKDKIIECLNEIDWINRLVPAQYIPLTALPPPEVVKTKPSDQEIAKMEKEIDVLLRSMIIPIHGEMYEQYQKSVKPLMEDVKKYLVDARTEIM
jgi:hypothetical protein